MYLLIHYKLSKSLSKQFNKMKVPLKFAKNAKQSLSIASFLSSNFSIKVM
jgi:hypothetical protein